MAGQHNFPDFLVLHPKLVALPKSDRNKIENAKDIVSSLHVENGYRKRFPSQHNQHYWDYYLAAGKPRSFKNRYMEVHPGLLPDRNVIREMLDKVTWLKTHIESGDLPKSDGKFIWARATGAPILSRQDQLRVAGAGLSLPAKKVTV